MSAGKYLKLLNNNINKINGKLNKNNAKITLIRI
jgi:hypothetical protein